MKITVAIDSLKGSLASMEAGNAAKGGILRVYPEAEVFVRPLADGGEGTVDALTEGLGGRIHTISVSDPLGRPLQADYGILTSPGQGEPLAVIEMAAASGHPPRLPAFPDWHRRQRHQRWRTRHALRAGISISQRRRNARLPGCRRTVRAFFHPYRLRSSRTVRVQLPDRLRCHQSALRSKWLQCRLWSAKGRFQGRYRKYGSLDAGIRRPYCPAISTRRSNGSRHGCRRRSRICLFKLYERCPGTGRLDRAGRNFSGIVHPEQRYRHHR